MPVRENKHLYTGHKCRYGRQASTNGAGMLVRNIIDLEVYSSKHPHMELMKLVYKNVTVRRVLKSFPKYFLLLANSWYCSQLRALMLVSHINDSRNLVLPEKLTVPQLVKKFPTFYGPRKFITSFKSIHHLSLSWVRPIQSMTPHPISWTSILIRGLEL